MGGGFGGLQTALELRRTPVEVTLVDGDAVTIEAPDGAIEPVPARTVIWAAGVAASSHAAKLGELTGAEVDGAGPGVRGHGPHPARSSRGLRPR